MSTALGQYTPRLHQYLRRLLRNPADIPDVVQETFRRFVSRADRPEIVKDPLAFLLGMARNVARELSYEEQRQVVTFDSELVERHGDTLDQASSGFAVEELIAQTDIARALTRLPDAHLAVLMLVDGEGRSYDEAAQLTGFTRSTVATYLMQARARLRTCLEDEDSGSRDPQDVRK
jgi:RNA polymerase sigma factor (sigma-70 family)